MDEAKTFALTIRASLAGYPVEITIPACTAGQLASLAPRLRSLGLVPPGQQTAGDVPDSWVEVEQAAAARATRQVRQRTTPPAGDAPCCDLHGTPMRPGRYGWYCPKKLSNGEYCKHRISFDDIPAPASTGA